MDKRRPKHPLRESERPEFELGGSVFRVVDLFCGAGGLTLGVAQAVYGKGLSLEVPLAVDCDAEALSVYSANFPKADSRISAVEKLFDGDGIRALTRKELSLKKTLPNVDALIGGPPCQGHSDLNNRTRRDDPKNDLYLRMLRAARVLAPTTVLIENVPTVIHAKSGVVEATKAGLNNLGYSVSDAVIALDRLGVAQKRRRHILLACRQGEASAVLKQVADTEFDLRDLRWAIGDLLDVKPDGLDKPPTANEANLKRMRYLLDNDEWNLPNKLRPPCHQDGRLDDKGQPIVHSYKSMYGRLSWDRPAQTVTSGFGSIGQGRYMHPERCRALTAHEAARLQGFPDYFDFASLTRRASLATVIGNAVPPALGCRVFETLFALNEGD